MIVVDTSALIAIVLREAESERCESALVRADEVLISAGTLAEALMVSARRRVLTEMAELLDDLALSIEPVTEQMAYAIGKAYDRWGRGLGNSARLNMGDCYAYALAKGRDLPLLFVGNDFSQTDVVIAASPPSPGFHEP